MIFLAPFSSYTKKLSREKASCCIPDLCIFCARLPNFLKTSLLSFSGVLPFEVLTYRLTVPDLPYNQIGFFREEILSLPTGNRYFYRNPSHCRQVGGIKFVESPCIFKTLFYLLKQTRVVIYFYEIWLFFAFIGNFKFAHLLIVMPSREGGCHQSLCGSIFQAFKKRNEKCVLVMDKPMNMVDSLRQIPGKLRRIRYRNRITEKTHDLPKELH